jgi:hypothetical protein
MKVKIKRDIQMTYSDNRTIEIEIPDDVEDIRSYIEEQMEENDEIEEELMDADVEEYYSDPEHIFYEVSDENGEHIVDWQDY